MTQPVSTLQATLFPQLKNPTGRPLGWSWPMFCTLMADPPPGWRADDKANLPLLKLGRFENHSRAKGSALELITGIEADHDDGTVAPEAAAEMLRVAGIRGIVATTASHSPLLPRWRVFCPLSRAYQPDARSALVARLNGVLGAALSPESFVQKQTFFVGRLNAALHYGCFKVDGACIDTLDELDDGAIGLPHTPNEAPAPDEARAFTLAGNAASWPDNRKLMLSALNAIDPACSYRVWMEVSAALYFASGGEALADWLEWCAKAPEKFPGDEAATTKWHQFGQMTAYSAGSIYHHAQETGWRMDHAHKVENVTDTPDGDDLNRTPLVTVDDCLNNWVWLSEQNLVVLRERDNLILKYPNVLLDYSASKTLPADTGIRRRKALVCVAEVWQERTDRAAAVSATFAPGMPPFCNDPSGRKCFNLWKPTARIKPADINCVSTFLAHVEYLVPNAKQREWFLQWVAHIEQRPEVLPHHHWLMITRAQGIGRNWLASLFKRLWPRQVALACDLLHMIESGFNGILSKTVMACVDELDVGGTMATKNSFNTSLKALLTAEEREINVKYGLKSVEFNTTRWLLLSNSHAAVPITAADRRLNVVRNPTQPLSPAYYTTLYTALDDAEFVNAVGWYLRNMDISTFNPGARAEMSEMKRVLVSVSRDEVENAIDAFCEEWPSAIAPTEFLRSFVASTTGLHKDKLRYINKAVQNTAAEALPDPLRVHGAAKTALPCVMVRDHDKWREASTPDKIRECLLGINQWQDKTFGELPK